MAARPERANSTRAYRSRSTTLIVGFFPSRKPAYGAGRDRYAARGRLLRGVVAGTVFKRIAKRPSVLGLREAATPGSVIVRAADPSVTPGLWTKRVLLRRGAGRDGVMPDLRGPSARTAVIHWRAASCRHGGHGVVKAKDPMDGTPLDRGSSVACGSTGSARSTRGFGRPAMTVAELLVALVQPSLLSAPPVLPDVVGSTAVTAVVYDSRRAVPGAVFVALRGQKDDGARFAPQAAARGAVLVSPSLPRCRHRGAWLLGRTRAWPGVAGDRFHGIQRHPARRGDHRTEQQTTPPICCARSSRQPRARGLLGTVVYSLVRDDREATLPYADAPDGAHVSEMVTTAARAVMEVRRTHASARRRRALCGRRLQ